MGPITLLAGNASRRLARRIAGALGLEITPAIVSRFRDGEIRVQILENIRGTDVFIVQSTNPPAEHLLELLFLVDAAKRASAARITAVIPYFGYARQDRKDQPRVPISAKLVANLLETAGIHRVLTLDLHTDQIQGFFDVPVDNLYATPVFKTHFSDLPPNTVVVAPDVGATRRARAIAKKLGNFPIALIDKRRPQPNAAEVMHVIGEVEGKEALIVDDILDTGTTLVKAAEALKKHGALRVRAAITHGLFSGDAREKVERSVLEEVVITDSVELPPERYPRNTVTLSVDELLAEAIVRIHEARSISELFA